MSCFIEYERKKKPLHGSSRYKGIQIPYYAGKALNNLTVGKEGVSSVDELCEYGRCTEISLFSQKGPCILLCIYMYMYVLRSCTLFTVIGRGSSSYIRGKRNFKSTYVLGTISVMLCVSKELSRSGSSFAKPIYKGLEK